MERMMDLEEMFRKEAEKYKNSKSVEVYEEQLEGWFKIIDELREENKKLNEKLEQAIYWKVDYEKSYKQADAKKDELLEENKKLNVKIASLEGEIKGLNYTIEKLKEENQYRESVADVLPEGKEHIAEETIQDLQARIKELNEDIKEIEKNQEYRYHRCMKAERQVQHSLGGDDELIYEEGLYD